jgi:hypothetical protein
MSQDNMRTPGRRKVFVLERDTAPAKSVEK